MNILIFSQLNVFISRMNKKTRLRKALWKDFDSVGSIWFFTFAYDYLFWYIFNVVLFEECLEMKSIVLTRIYWLLQCCYLFPYLYLYRYQKIPVNLMTSDWHYRIVIVLATNSPITLRNSYDGTHNVIHSTALA